MFKRRNYRKVPSSTLKEIENIESRYIKVGIALELSNADIAKGSYKHLSIEMNSGKITYDSTIVPSAAIGRYSKYNTCGREIIRKDLPKKPKWFSHDVYPYGNTNRDPVTATYSRKVWQREEWLPEFLTLNISQQDSNNSEKSRFVITSDEILDKEDKNFEFRLLFNINLISENCGSYQIFSDNTSNEEIMKTLYVDWELLPPGHSDITIIDKKFKSRTSKEQKEILERYEYINSFHPKSFIKGTNTFNQYFGAIMDNDVVVLENIRSGNAIYVFYQDWKTLSKLSRTELMKRKSEDMIRIPHMGNWKQLLETTIKNK